MKEVFDYLGSLHPISNELKEFLVQHTREHLYKKNELILKEGEIAKHIWILISGTVRCFHYENDKEITNWFLTHGQIIVAVNSLAEQRPSLEMIVAMEDCNILSLSNAQLQYAYDHFPEARSLSKQIVLTYFKRLDRQLHLVRLTSLEERYELLKKEFPDLFFTIPLNYLASYIGVSTSTFNRLRRSERNKRKKSI
jgi:CRP-like cAMP-binding protein